MSWILLTVFAYLGFAVNAVIDRILLRRDIPNPAVYAFFIGVLSISAILLFPLAPTLPGAPVFALALIAGMLFTFALFAYFSAIKRSEASRVVPAATGLVPLFTLLLSLIFLGEALTSRQYLAFAMLLAGGVLISWHRKEIRHQSVTGIVIAASLLFAASFTLTKHLFNQEPFLSVFIWTRVGLGAGALLLLFSPRNRYDIFHAGAKTKKEGKFLFFTGQGIGAAASILQHVAIALGSVALVNALQGLQYVFLLTIAAVLARRWPNLLEENLRGRVLVQKIIATAVISIGLLLLTT
jgi:drug/metabolite transporter (DMT)-like permease